MSLREGTSMKSTNWSLVLLGAIAAGALFGCGGGGEGRPGTGGFVRSPGDKSTRTNRHADPVDASRSPPPAAEYVPTDYEHDAGGVPMMGLHWHDLSSPEYHEVNGFTTTILYGSYAGSFIFTEPMITLAYLQKQTVETRPLKLPAKYAPA